MATIAELQIKVDTTQLEKAKKLLAELPSVSQKVAQATKAQAEGMQQAEASSEGLSRRAETLIRQTKELEATYKQGRAAVLDYRAEQENVANVIRPMTDSIRQQEAAIRANTEAKKAQMEVDRAVQKSVEGLDTARYNMIQSLQQEIATFGMSREEMLLWEASLIGAKDQVAPLVQELQRLKAAKEAEAAAGASGNSAREKEKTSREAANQARREEIALIEQKLREQQRLAVEAPSDAERNAARERAIAYKYEREDLIRLDNQRRKLRSGTKLDQNETAKLRNEYIKLRGQLDPTEKKFEELGRTMEKLRKQLSSGAISVEEFKEAEAMVDRQVKQLEQLGRTSGKTAKEINFAMRGLPAQFTDIAVSLQGGQRPLTVLLQQGGQIKDMFGGIRPALAAMGGLLVSMITPLNIAIGAVVAFGFSWHQAQKETEEYNRTLITTGNSIGITTDKLTSLAHAVSGEVGSVGLASGVLNQLVRTGKITEENLERATVAAIKWSRATGESIEDVIQEFTRVAESPLEALSELQSRYNFLTPEILNTVTALQAQGREQEAIDTILNSIFDTMDRRADKMDNHLTAWGRLLRSAKEQGAGLWDSLKGLQRELPYAERVLRLNRQLADAEERYLRTGRTEWLDKYRRIYQRITDLSLERTKNEEDAQKRRDNDALADAALQGQNLLKTEADSARTTLEVLIERRNAIEEAYQANVRYGQVNEVIQKRYQAAMSAVTEAILEENGRILLSQLEVDKARDDAATKELLRIRERQAALLAQTGDVRKRGREELELERMRQMFLDLELKQKQGVLTEEQRSLLANKEKLLAEQETTVELEKQVAHNKEIVRQEGYAAALRLKEQADREKYADALLGSGLSDKAVARMKERNALTREHARAVAKIEEEYRKTGNRDTRDSNLAAENASTERRRQELEKFYEDQDKQQADWSLGARKAFANFLEEGRNVAGMTQNFFTSAFGNIEDSLVNFVTTGKFSFKSLVTSILGDLARMATRIAANQIIMSIIGAFMPSPGANTGNVSAGGINNVGSAFNDLRAGTGPFQALGGGWNKGVQFFANGGAFTNSIVSRPTAFGTQSGLGVMGEAGPEAIMPLSRTSDGKLGVHAVGGAGSVVAPVSVVVNVDSGAGGSGPTGQAESTGRAVQMAIKTEVERVISINMKPGGSIWRAMNSR